MKPRFQPHPEASNNTPPAGLIDSESFDVSEQRFAASLEKTNAESRFVVLDESATQVKHGDEPSAPIPAAAEGQGQRAGDPTGDGRPEACDEVAESTTSVTSKPDSEMDGASWRAELAAKMKQYRAQKHPRSPRYPSLQLKFEEVDFGATARAIPQPEGMAEREEDASLADPAPGVLREPESYEEPERMDQPTPLGKILAFPAPLVPPPPAIDELAEPILDQPRILEVPDIMPPPPALGGILIEAAEESPREKRRGFELPLIAAPFSKRVLAGALDALIVAGGFAMFASIFLRMSSVPPSVRQAAGIGAVLLAMLWAGYQYLMLVHAGSTPGLKLAKLRLSRFDGTQAPLKLRRWRVLASLLSGLSLGLGYAWCFLDEDQLCWHDRITHTYMAPRTRE